MPRIKVTTVKAAGKYLLAKPLNVAKLLWLNLINSASHRRVTSYFWTVTLTTILALAKLAHMSIGGGGGTQCTSEY